LVQIGTEATLLIGGFIIAIGLVLYVSNRFEEFSKNIRTLLILSLSILAFLTPSVSARIFGDTIKAETPIDQLWQTFDQTSIDQHIKDGHVVFVDVTADWCITCQVNKQFVLADEDVYTQLSARNVVAMQADWTLPSDTISLYLASFQRYGIPFNAIYGPAAPQGIPLPELLSKDIVLKALKQAKG
jgi:suppressor for copper-sensitivity B